MVINKYHKVSISSKCSDLHRTIYIRVYQLLWFTYCPSHLLTECFSVMFSYNTPFRDNIRFLQFRQAQYHFLISQYMQTLKIQVTKSLVPLSRVFFCYCFQCRWHYILHDERKTYVFCHLYCDHVSFKASIFKYFNCIICKQ